MKIKITQYKGYDIHQRTDVRTHTCLIHLNGEPIKGIAGDIAEDGTNNRLSKAKTHIDTITIHLKQTAEHAQNKTS